MEILVALAVVVMIAVVLLKGFDMIAGRGPKQVSDGIHRTSSSEDRIPCPMCAEKILPQAKICPFCKSEVQLAHSAANATGRTDDLESSLPSTIQRIFTPVMASMPDREIGRLKVVLGIAALGLGLLMILWGVSHLAEERPASEPAAAHEGVTQKVEVQEAKAPTMEASAPVVTPVVSPPAPVVTPSPVPPAPAELAVPPDEQEFLEAVQRGRAAFQSAPNEMAQGGTRSQRRLAICQTLTQTSVFNWVGHIEKLLSNSDGRGVLKISIAKDIRVETFNNDFSDDTRHTLIDPTSSLFAALSHMKEGDPVVFSGSFFPSQVDCTEEHSVTLEGSMTDPEFVFRFSAVSAAGKP